MPSPELSGLAAFRLLARIQARVSLRAFQSRQSVFMWIVLTVLFTYSAFVLVVLGGYFDRFSELVDPGAMPMAVVNQYALAAFVSLFFIRFLFQKTPRMRVVPFLHLPISRGSLTTFFQLSSLGSIHNVYPLLFFVPFWNRFVRPEASLGGSLWWMAAILLLIVASHFANLFLRSSLRQRAGMFYGLMTLFIGTAFVDELMGAGLQRTLSEFLFADILRGGVQGMVLLGAFTLLCIVLSTRELMAGLRPEPSVGTTGNGKRLGLEIPDSWGLTGQLVRLELLLMWRNRRPRHYLIISLLFSTMYLLLMMVPGGLSGSVAMGAMLGLFASGGFILNYGQLMFSWDSRHYPALLSRNIPLRSLVKAKLIVLQASCLVLFVVSMPIFVVFRPEYFPLHVAFLFYNAGITSVLIMDLAARNTVGIDIGRSGGFFNYEGFSAKHWIWFIPTALPPLLFMMVMGDNQTLALIILASAGFVSILATDLWTRYFGRALRIRKHAMLDGFRNSAT
ncbi:MAG: DUF5687 family protein [Rhodothermales bacterium]